LVASVVAGLLWDHVSHAAVFLYGAAFAIAGSIAFDGLGSGDAIRRPTSRPLLALQRHCSPAV
jgi:hypothetical protein